MFKTLIINIQRNDGFKWHNADNIFVKGYLFDKDNKFYRDSEIINLFSNVQLINDFIERLKETNGHFAIIINKNNQLFASVDRLRSIPLFYIHNDKNFIISDDVEFIKESHSLSELDNHNLSVFKLTGYTCNSNTLIKNLKQLQAGQYLHFNNKNDEFKIKFYFLHTHDNYIKNNNEIYLIDKIEKISDNFTKRLIKSVNNKTIVIPLSSGYDSRYIACMLKKAGYKKVICYTYGRKDSSEVDIAGKVAKNLNYKWHFIEYNYEKWEHVFKSSEFLKYCIYASNYCSLPHIQDYIAIQELTNDKLIPSDSIIVPGFCGDLLGGSYIPSEIIEHKEKFLLKEGINNYLFKRHFILNTNEIKNNEKKNVINKINEFTSKFSIENIENFISVNEAWFTNHKVSKYVVNSLRVYEFWGYEWRVPLWDNELIEFWYTIPIKYRNNSYLYVKFLFERVFNPFKVDFAKEKPLIRSNFILTLRRIFPIQLLKSIKYFNKVFQKRLMRFGSDINALDELAFLLQNDLKIETPIKRIDNAVNEILIIWFIKKYIIKDKIKIDIQIK